jgi:hypothetical protein
MSTTPSIDQLKRAVSISEEIEKLQAELEALLGASAKVSAPAVSAAPAAPKARKAKRGLSAEGRARIAAAQKARWAKAKGSPAATPAPAAKPGRKAKAKRVLSPEARARIVAAVKRRWARERKAK